MSQATPIRACILVFEKMDLIDFTAPFETLYYAYKHGTEEHLISLEIAAPADEVTTEQGVTIKRNISFEQALESLAQYDVLIAPGASYKTTKDMCDSADHPIIKIIKQFCSLPPPEETKTHQRLMLSICSGSFFLAAAGVLAGRRATTHHTLLRQLEEATAKHGKTEVGRHRFVDAGLLESGVRVISSGGLTSGFDASLYAMELLCGPKSAKFASEEVLEYPWQKSEGIVLVSTHE